MMDTMTQIQKQQRELVERIQAVSRAKARRYLERLAKERKWPPEDLELVTAMLGV